MELRILRSKHLQLYLHAFLRAGTCYYVGHWRHKLLSLMIVFEALCHLCATDLTCEGTLGEAHHLRSCTLFNSNLYRPDCEPY